MNHPELANQLTTAVSGLLPTMIDQIVGAGGEGVQMNSPLVLESRVDEMLQEFAANSVLVQFSFAGRRESAQCLILSLETANALYAEPDADPGDFSEAALQEIRGPLEAMVQGICVGLGNFRNEVVVASDLSIRLGSFARPSSMQPSDLMPRVQVALGVGATIGSLAWVLDYPTAHFVAGLVQPSTTSSPAAFGNLPSFGGSRGGAEEETHGLDILMDIPLDISVELGRTSLVVKEVVDLGVGSIVEIDKAAGEPVDVLVNGKLVARGEVVVIEDNFGVRITEILNPRERLARLGEAA